MITRRIAVAAFATMLVAACGKVPVQVIDGPPATAQVKFFNFGVSAPGVNFYANTDKVTAISSTSGVESTTGVATGGVGSGGFYSALSPGQYDFTGKIAAATDKDLVITKVTSTIADGKFYSFFISGIYDATAKNAEGFIVEDAIPATFDYTQAYVRFVNAISNSQPMTLYAKNTVTGIEGAVGAAISYKAGGAFTALAPAAYDLATRTTGSTTNAIARTGVSFVAGHVYTVGARGDMTVTSTTLATRPQLDNTANR